MKKVLIISYYWPPAGGPGVQRWLKFAKYLPEFGIEPVVYVPENPQYPIVDENLENQVPSDITVIKKKIFEPARIFSVFAKEKAREISSGIISDETSQSPLERIGLWIRGNFFIPDARVYWVGPSVRFLKKYLKENSIDTVITTGPPHSLHLIGMKLKEKLGVHWIADFRDPWTSIGYHKSLKLSNFASNRHRDLEAQVLTSADRIIVTSNLTRNEFAQITEKPITVITNGYDVERRKDVVRDSKFTVSHIGSLLSKRNPSVLWQALSDMVKNVPMFADEFEMRLVGTVGQDVINSIKMYGLDKFTRLYGYVPHDKAVELQQSSQVLLLIEINSADTKCIIPGKLFEYMVSGRPVIAIGPAGSDIASIVDETGIGIFADYSERDKIRETLESWFSRYLNGSLEVESGQISKYSRRSLTEQLSEVIKKQWES